MAAKIATQPPSAFRRGDTVKWLQNLPDYLPSDGWVLTYEFAFEAERQSIVATDNGDDRHLITISTAISAGFSLRKHFYQAYVESGGERFTVDTGAMDVLADVSTATDPFDEREHAERMLELVEAMLEGKATSDQMSMTIRGRSITRYTFEELMKLRNYYRWEAQKQADATRLANGLAPRSVIGTRFI